MASLTCVKNTFNHNHHHYCRLKIIHTHTSFIILSTVGYVCVKERPLLQCSCSPCSSQLQRYHGDAAS